MLRTLRGQLFVGAAAVLITMLLLLLWGAQETLRYTLRDSFFTQLEQIKPLLNASIGPLMAVQDHAALQDVLEQGVATGSVAYIEVRDLLERRVAHAATGELDQPMIEDWAPVLLAGQPYGSVRFGLLTGSLDEAQRAVRRSIAIGGAVVLVGGLVLLAVLMRVLTSRLQRMVRASEAISRGEHAVRLPEDGPSELRQLAAAFNSMVQTLAQRMQELADGEGRQRSLVGALAEGVVFQDAGGHVLACNEAAVRLLGLPRERLATGARLAPDWPAVDAQGQPLDPQRHPAVLALRTGQAQRGVLMGLRSPGRGLTWLSVNAVPLIRPGEAQAHATVTSFSDITTSVEARAALTRLNAELEDRVASRTAELSLALQTAQAASAAKSEFLSRMSHELRTPLNAILGFAQLLRMRAPDPHAPEVHQLHQIETAGWHLLNLINEVLDLARIEAGKLTVSMEHFNLTELAAQAVEAMGDTAQRAEVQLQAVAGCVFWVHADRTRVRQIFDNLLSNAVKYNRPGGRVWVTLERLPAGRVQVTVGDTGRGFTQEQLAGLFQPFTRYQAPGEVTEGTGIGLVITQRLVHAMGGRLDVQGAPGEGAVFRFDLAAGQEPAELAVPTVPGALMPDDGPTRRVLYVEDNPSNVELFRQVLTARPAIELRVATDGLDGLRQARTFLPDLIVIDVDLPRLDGLSLSRRLNDDPATRDIPRLALSANAMPGDIERGLRAGFAQYLTKPIQVRRLLEAVDQWITS